MLPNDHEQNISSHSSKEKGVNCAITYENISIPIQCSSAFLPIYHSSHASGADLRACIDEEMNLAPQQRVLIPTGISLAIPAGYEGQIRSRSGLAWKRGLVVLNSPGTIDSDYRGEIKIALINQGSQAQVIHRGDRIAQLVIAPVVKAIFKPVNNLCPTDRSTGGFGSSGLQ